MKKNTLFMCELFAILGNTFWGLSNLWLTIAQQYADTKIILSSRFLIAFIILTILLIVGKQKISFKGKPLLPLLAMISLEPLSYYLESYGVLYSGVTLTSITLAIVPILTILGGAFFLKETSSKKQLLACGVPMIGVILCALASGSIGGGNTKGLFYLGGNIIALSAFRIVNKKASAYYSTFERTYALITSCMLTFTVVALVDVRGDISAYTSAWANPAFAGSVLVLAITASVLANFLINHSTAHISIAKTASYSNLTTVVAAFAGIVILHEQVTTGMLLGMTLIVIGVMLVNHFDAQNVEYTEETIQPSLTNEIA